VELLQINSDGVVTDVKLLPKNFSHTTPMNTVEWLDTIAPHQTTAVILSGQDNTWSTKHYFDHVPQIRCLASHPWFTVELTAILSR